MFENIQKEVLDKMADIIKQKVKTQFISSFEELLLPVFEKYLQKIFEKVCATFEKGHKFYVDRLMIENSKFNNLRENLNTLLGNFISASDNIKKTVQDTAQVQYNLTQNHSAESIKTEFTNLNTKLETISNRQNDIMNYLMDMESRMQVVEKTKQQKEDFFEGFEKRIMEAIHPSGSSKPQTQNDQIIEINDGANSNGGVVMGNSGFHQSQGKDQQNENGYGTQDGNKQYSNSSQQKPQQQGNTSY